MNDPQKEARDIAARHGIKAYESPAETKQEPGECPRKALESITRIPVMPFPDPGAHSWRAFAEAVHTAYQRIQQQAHAALSAPCPCEQLRGERDQIRIKAEMLERVLTASATRHLGDCEKLKAERDQLQARYDRLRESIQEDHDEFYAGCAEHANAAYKERDAAIAERDRLRTECEQLRDQVALLEGKFHGVAPAGATQAAAKRLERREADAAEKVKP